MTEPLPGAGILRFSTQSSSFRPSRVRDLSLHQIDSDTGLPIESSSKWNGARLRFVNKEAKMVPA